MLKNTARRTVGRPAKPYGESDPIGSRDWVIDVLGPPKVATDLPGIYATVPRRGQYAGFTPSSHVPTVAKAIVVLLEAADRPLSRNLLEASLTHVYGVRPTTVSRALVAVRADQVVLTTVPVRSRKKPTDLYTLGRKPTPGELLPIKTLLQLQVQVFDDQAQLIGQIAEAYVYGCLHASRRYRMPRKSRLGYFRDDLQTRKADIIVTHLASDERVGVSVRNTREVAYPGHDHIRELEDAREVFGVDRMLLVASYLSAEAKARLHTWSVPYLELGRQLIPAEMPDGRLTMKLLRQLTPVIGPQPYETMPSTLRFPRPNQRTPLTVRDLQFFASDQIVQAAQ